jgi:DNA-binding MarR family transcriptional regulator
VLELTQTDIAALTGLSRQTVNAELHRLEQRGLLELAFRQVRIADVERLLAELGSTQDERQGERSAACR